MLAERMRFKYIFHVSTSFWLSGMQSGSSCPRVGCRFSSARMPSCSRCRKRPACAPSIWVWWNWKESGSVVRKSPLRYRPQMRKGLLKMPLFMPTAPSSSVSTMAEVPMTMQSGRSWFSQLSAAARRSRWLPHPSLPLRGRRSGRPAAGKRDHSSARPGWSAR